jgi:hypothetical protein
MIDPQTATQVTNPDLQAQLLATTAVLTQISSFLSHVSVGGATAHAIEWLKAKPGTAKWWALLSNRGKVIVGAVLAGLGSLGITATFQHDPQHVGVYSFVFSGVTVASVGQHLWSFVQSWVIQQGWYAGLIKPKPVTGVPEKPIIIGAPVPAPQPVPVVEVKP